MPPVMMTKVQAIASTPFTAVACRMPSTLSICMNAGEAKLKKISSRIRLAKASSFCRADGPNSRALRPDALASLPPVSIPDCIVIDLRPFFGSCGSRGLALRRQLHDALLAGVLRRQLTGDAALAHHHD